MKLIYVTCANRQEAEKLAEIAVTEKLAACANIFQEHLSLYKWEGKLQKEQEVAMLLKTSDEKAEALQNRLATLHSYDTPCILVLPVDSWHQPFLDWIQGL